uniref:Uncharacterized protein n=1 Tax=Candidatus Kentrum sp. FW TaxID=2126338 RepID=A0A450TBW7_9GAMM|nr:MAG: hypothetical protein BECKFW1821A_GA0114235_11663 [Candidatus Kentron sp. FW]
MSNVIRTIAQLFTIETAFQAGNFIVVDDPRISIRLPEKIPCFYRALYFLIRWIRFWLRLGCARFVVVFTPDMEHNIQ